MTTQIVGAPNKLAVTNNDSPHGTGSTGGCTVAGPNTDPSCTIIIVAVEDANGSVETGLSGTTISATFDSGSCSGSGGGTPTVRQSTTTTAGKATFAISSSGGYSACVITFSSANVSSANATATWTSGGADHLACTFFPNPIPADGGASQSTGTVSVRDSAGNVVSVGTYGVSFSRTNGNVTTLPNGSIQNTSNGYAYWTVKSTNSVGTDTYTPTLMSGYLPRPATSCNISTF
jgi:hypothetical protein